MKKLFLILLISILYSGIACGDSILLDSPEAIESPSAYKLDWEIVKIDVANKRLHVRYRWLDSNGDPIYSGRKTTHHLWSCRDEWSDVNPVENEECIAAGNPDPCCTGVGEGTCDDATQTDSCFSDIFGFTIRAQDVGTSLGIGLRTLMWNEMKQDILTPGNDGTFE